MVRGEGKDGMPPTPAAPVATPGTTLGTRAGWNDRPVEATEGVNGAAAAAGAAAGAAAAEDEEAEAEAGAVGDDRDCAKAPLV